MNEMFIVLFLLLIIAFLFVKLLIYLRREYEYMRTYWKRSGIPYIPPAPIIGNTKEALIMKTNFSLHLSAMYKDPKTSDKPVTGFFIFSQPALLVREPEIIKSILIKDFEYFTNRYVQADAHSDTLAQYNLFFTRDSVWKSLRLKLSPIFTTRKMRQMYSTMMKVGQELDEYLQTMDDNVVANVNQVCGYFTMEVIANIACGIRADTFSNPKIYRIAKSIFTFDFIRYIKTSIVFFIPRLSIVLKVAFFPHGFCQFMRKTVTFILKERENEFNNNNHEIERNDIIDILIKMRNEAQQQPITSDMSIFRSTDCLIAQSGTFVTAGFETSATTMSFALYELAKNPKIQDKLRKEICEALVSCHGDLTYDQTQSLSYLSMILDETLRLYPILPYLDRQYRKISDKDYSLLPHYDYNLEDGTPIFIPIYAIQRDPKYWDKPDEFNPERFSSDNKSLHKPMTYLPFGSGQHNCIGMRIGLLQAKVGLINFLKNHYVTLSDRVSSVAQFEVKAFILQYKGGSIHLHIHRDNMYNNKC